MNSFLKSFLASLLALFVGVFALFAVVAIFINTMAVLLLSSGQKQIDSITPSVLELRLDASIVESPEANAVAEISPWTFEIVRRQSLYDVLTAIEGAASDDNIQGIYMNLSTMSPLSLVALDEIRAAVVEFKTSGKFVVSFCDTYSLRAYYLASVSDRIFMNPVGYIDWKGLASQSLFFKNALDKLDVQPQIVRHGKYKSAVEPFTETEMTPENRRQQEELLSSIWNRIVEGVSSSREITPQQMNRYASELTFSDAVATVRSGAVDSLCYANDAVAHLRSLVGQEVVFTSMSDYIAYTKDVLSRDKSKNKVAIIYAQGEIVDGKASSEFISLGELTRKLTAVRKDDNIKAIVLRINSPGGSALAAEGIWKEVELTRQKKPVVVSMGSYAASGGYYIAAPADVILCSPATITGSIGVFGMMFNAGKAFENLGVDVDVVKTNPSADMGSVFRPMTSAEYNVVSANVDTVYTTFVRHVAQGRNMTFTQADSLAQGRVWSGVDAVGIGLADGFGGLREATFVAAQKAGVEDDFRVITLTDSQTPIQQLMTAIGGVSAAYVKQDPILKIYTTLKESQERDRVQAIMPQIPYIL